jgi:thioredoxin reductase (NADPH)
MIAVQTADVLVIGSGPAGCTASIYAARAMLKTVLIEGMQPGGQLTITTEVENYPGFQDIQGPELMQRMRDHVRAFDVDIRQDHISRLDLDRKDALEAFVATGDDGCTYHAKTVILATGAQAKWLGLDSEKKFRGSGVSACATCDGFFHKGKRVVVVGGGNAAVEEAIFLTNFALEVVLVHRRDSLRAEKILQKRLFANPKIRIIWNTVVEEIVGDDKIKRVSGVRVSNMQTAEVELIECSGVFVAIGHKPASELVQGQLDMDSGGYVVIKSGTSQTSVSGVFAAGDIADPVYRQAITSAGMGCMAALDAERYLAAQ